VLPYSSGTTGLPKGVMLTHYSITANLAQISGSHLLDHKDDDVLVAVLPFFHIYGMAVILIHGLLSGTKLVVMPKFEPVPFLDVVKNQKITKAFVAPPIVAFLAKHPVVDKYLPFPALQDLFCAAAPLGQELAVQAVDRLKVGIRQGFGMTELSPVGHLMKFGKTKYSSIGEILPGIDIKLVDPETGAEIDALSNTRGEMWLKGENVMKGYLDNPGATAETVDEDGYMHTGDIAYMDADGDFFIVDRLKELIKVKGFQCAPAELEDLLMQNPKIADVGVIGVPAPREGDGQVPKAFVVKKPDVELTEEEVKSFVAERVVEYKKLGYVKFVDSIPKNPSGKILRKILRQQEGGTFA
jgi:acyl-CoA synthetase (AMP-forming)/AMP-acid ligase II